MSRNFRPVKEIWGEHSSCFLDTDDLIKLLTELASANDCGCVDESEHRGDIAVVWIEKGQVFLDLLARVDLPQLIPDWVRETCEDESLDALLGNFQNLASEWKDSLDPKDGSLRFYIDYY